MSRLLPQLVLAGSWPFCSLGAQGRFQEVHVFRGFQVGPVAQLDRHRFPKPGVAGSSPAGIAIRFLAFAVTGDPVSLGDDAFNLGEELFRITHALTLGVPLLSQRAVLLL